MSAVANQYNILADTLRRGIAGFQAEKLQSAQIALGTKQLEYEIGKDEEERDWNRKVRAAKTPGLEQEQALGERDYEMLNEQLTTTINRENLSKYLIDTPIEVAGTEFNIELTEQFESMTGLEFDKDNNYYKTSTGRPVTAYELNNSEDLRRTIGFMDWEKFMKGIGSNLEAELKETSDGWAAKAITGKLQKIQDKLGWIEKNRGDYEARRTNAMIDAYAGTRNPRMLAAMDKQIALQMQREKTAMTAQYGTDGLASKKYYNGKDMHERFWRKGDFATQVEIDRFEKSLGFLPGGDKKDTLEDYKLQILEVLDRFGKQGLSEGQRRMYEQMFDELTPDQVAKVVIGTEAGSLSLLQKHGTNLSSLLQGLEDLRTKTELMGKWNRGELRYREEAENYFRLMWAGNKNVPPSELQKLIEYRRTLPSSRKK